MKKVNLILIILSLCVMMPLNVFGEAKYKGLFGVGGALMYGDTYDYVMGCDGKVGLSLRTEHGVCFQVNDWRHDGVFFGAGIGFDYVNVALSDFNQEDYETINILSNSVMAIPMYLTIKYIYNMRKISMVCQGKGGYYKWFRGHIVENDKNLNKNYDIPYKGSYLLGLGMGVRFPINKQYGVSVILDYDFMGANVKWQDENISNHKIGLSLAFDF